MHKILIFFFCKDYSLDIFFRQLWVDKRLQFDLSADGINELVIGSDMLHKIWLPDTFIGNNFDFVTKMYFTLYLLMFL